MWACTPIFRDSILLWIDIHSQSQALFRLISIEHRAIRWKWSNARQAFFLFSSQARVVRPSNIPVITRDFAYHRVRYVCRSCCSFVRFALTVREKIPISQRPAKLRARPPCHTFVSFCSSAFSSMLYCPSESSSLLLPLRWIIVGRVVW